MIKSKILIAIFASSVLILSPTVQVFAAADKSPGSITVSQEDILTGNLSGSSGISKSDVLNAIQKAKRTPVSKAKQDELSKIIANKKVVADPKAKTSLTKSVTLSTSGIYPERKGVILVTGDKYMGIIPLGHSAIVYSTTQVVESISDGVVFGKNNWNTSKGSCVAVTVSSTSAAQDASAADWCSGKVGLPYNYDYYNMDTRSKFYCSQLVWASFNDNYGIDLNTDEFDIFLFGIKVSRAIHPYELATNDKVYVIYRQNWTLS